MRSISDTGNTVGKGFLRKRACKGVLHTGKHSTQYRADMTPNDAPVAGILVNVKKMGVWFFHNRLIDLQQCKLFWSNHQRVATDPPVAIDNPSLFQQCQYFSDIAGIGANAYGHLIRVDCGWGFRYQNQDMRCNGKLRIHISLQSTYNCIRYKYIIFQNQKLSKEFK